MDSHIVGAIAAIIAAVFGYYNHSQGHSIKVIVNGKLQAALDKIEELQTELVELRVTKAERIKELESELKKIKELQVQI
jgi:hypothetical protein